MSSQKHTKVLIAGGSVAGLTLANILEKLGIDYLVLEKYGKVAPDLGASIGILPYGLRIFDQFGCFEDVKALLNGVDAGELLTQRDDNGKVVLLFEGANKRITERFGYSPVFVDRQMIIQVLYDKLPDKSKVLTNKGVTEVRQSTGGVEVVTADGETYHADILVGADGIHSTVREEMWRLADQETPGYFPVSDRSIPTEYCCIFGISRPSEKFPCSTQNVQGRDNSYLVLTGPDHRIYWFLFKKLPVTAYGKIPRYTKDQEDALVAEHASDHITDTLTFGELYALRKTSTLQALPEVVFSKWHYNRIMTIGDAAHKFNPISGHGGNSAIEDAAVLADQLHALFNRKGESITDADFVEAFQTTQSLRVDRATALLKFSHAQQSVQAMDTVTSKFIARYIVPLYHAEKMIDVLCGTSRGGTHIKALPLPNRPHSDLWDDEKGANLVDWRRVGYVFSATVAALAVFSTQTQLLPIASMRKLLLSS
ncbi:unnamed protein product [Alternaria alternata]